MEKALDEALEESPELLQQVDGINDSDVERPGKLEVVTGEAEGETDGSGGWILVGRSHQIQRKAREEVETRWPNQAKFHYGGVDRILRSLEEKKEAGHLEKHKEYLDKEEKIITDYMRKIGRLPQEEKVLSR